MERLAHSVKGYEQDVVDAKDFVQRGYTDVETLRATFAKIEPNLVRYPAIDPAIFRSKVNRFISSLSK